jgi:hypothetical protein
VQVGGSIIYKGCFVAAAKIATFSYPLETASVPRADLNRRDIGRAAAVEPGGVENR